MATVVVGTAGHIDHGKTRLLRALTGIDADRLPEERRRGMTIDVGYAHLTLPDGDEIDFVDVPGHDRLVGNMLVGAGEVDAALLVVAADDGPRAQTHEHVALLDALGIEDAVIAVTKADLVPADRLAEALDLARRAVAGTTFEGAPMLAVSGETGLGIAELRLALAALRDRTRGRGLVRPPGPIRLAIDRAFAAKGRGVVVTGSLRGGTIATGDRLRVEPGGKEVRVRELQVHGETRTEHGGGRTALNLGRAEPDDVRRGQVLTAGPGIEATDRVLASLRPPVAGQAGGSGRGSRQAALAIERGGSRLHIGTDQVEAVIARAAPPSVPVGADEVVVILRLERPVATFVGDRGVLRRSSPGAVVAGLRILDPHPPRGISRRRLTAERIADLDVAIGRADAPAALDALVALHGALSADRLAAAAVALSAGEGRPVGEAPAVRAAPSAPADAGGPRGLVLAPEIADAVARHAEALVAERDTTDPMSRGLPLSELRRALLIELRRRATIDRALSIAATSAVDAIVEDLLARGRLAREADRVRDPAKTPGIPAPLAEAMDRLAAALAVDAPPPLGEAARAVGCPPEGVRALEAAGRIVRLEPDLAWATGSYHRLAARALAMARTDPLTPAAFRDATGTSRRFVLAILEDLDRRGILARTSAGHVPGPRAPRPDAPAAEGRR